MSCSLRKKKLQLEALQGTRGPDNSPLQTSAPSESVPPGKYDEMSHIWRDRNAKNAMIELLQQEMVLHHLDFSDVLYQGPGSKFQSHEPKTVDAFLENHAWNQGTGVITMPGGPWANAPPAVQFL